MLTHHRSVMKSPITKGRLILAAPHLVFSMQELYETYNRKLASQQQAVAPQPAPPAAPPVQPESDDQQVQASIVLRCTPNILWTP